MLPIRMSDQYFTSLRLKKPFIEIFWCTINSHFYTAELKLGLSIQLVSVEMIDKLNKTNLAYPNPWTKHV